LFRLKFPADRSVTRPRRYLRPRDRILQSGLFTEKGIGLIQLGWGMSRPRVLPIDCGTHMKGKKKRKTVSLVLGSGGARGLAHIGVIRWLTENGHDIRSIAGSSMGALVGGILPESWMPTLTGWRP